MKDNLLDMCARAYIEYYRSQFKKYAWAVEYAESLIQTNPTKGLTFVLDVLNICKNEQEMAYVGSGALEDLLHRHIFEIKEDIKNIIHKNESMVTALRYTWAGTETPVNEFLIEINVKFTTKIGEKHPLRGGVIKSSAVDE